MAADIIGVGTRPRRKGRNLSNMAPSLHDLWQEVCVLFDAAREDWERRTDPLKPKQADGLSTARQRAKGVFDYSDFADEAYWELHNREWEAFWSEAYALSVGSPGSNKKPLRPASADLPPLLLHPVYVAIERWWRGHIGPFNPTFVRPYVDEDAPPPFDIFHSNPPARLLAIYAQALDDHYSLANCANLRDTLKRIRRRLRRKLSL